VLYLGRISLVVNTDLVLPFEDRINWSTVIIFRIILKTFGIQRI
jgi:hypothetical protein